MKKLAAFMWAFGLVLPLFLLMPSIADGRIGVAIGVGKIRVEEALKPGIINILPSVPVINNGDETTEYQMSVEYLHGQESDPELGLMPPQGWFVFKPQSFILEPGERQIVEVSLVLPINAKPGQYYGYLQAKPTIKAEGREAVIGIAAATKLWFNVEAANVFYGIYYRLLSLYAMWSFWVNLVLAVIGATIFVILFRRFFSFNIGFKKTAPASKIESEPAKSVKRGKQQVKTRFTKL